MADEITLTANLKFAKGNVTAIERVSELLEIDVSGTQYTQGVQSVGTSAELLDIGDITTVGWCWFKNLDATNYVLIGLASQGGSDVVKLKAGEVALFRAALSAIYVTANSAACELEYLLIED